MGNDLNNRRPLWILPTIILSQFAGGSLWFSGNAILDDLVLEWHLTGQVIGHATSAVLFGFIAGTLLYAWLTISDRYSPRKVFFVSTLLGAIANSLILVFPGDLLNLIVFRFATGFFIAGIYPVGMKIASGWYRKGLGEALGYLVGALVLGTAFPHGLKAAGYQLDWRAVMAVTSAVAITGGAAMLALVPDGPYIKRQPVFQVGALFSLFGSRDLRAAAFGYFGHMWELYAMWAFLPLFLAGYADAHDGLTLNVPLWAFAIIACGWFGCAVGGIRSRKTGSARVAFAQLAVSGGCCLLSPASFFLPLPLFLTFMIIWGITVAGDSPQYSAVIAQTAPSDLVGSALTLVNCIGFFITIVSIQVVGLLSSVFDMGYLMVILLPGPLVGLYSLRHLTGRRE